MKNSMLQKDEKLTCRESVTISQTDQTQSQKFSKNKAFFWQ